MRERKERVCVSEEAFLEIRLSETSTKDNGSERRNWTLVFQGTNCTMECFPLHPKRIASHNALYYVKQPCKWQQHSLGDGEAGCRDSIA